MARAVTSEHLARQRALRESLWWRFRQRLFPEPAEPAGEGLPTAADYEHAVQAADTTADSRFADAARVSQDADLHKRLAQMNNALELERGRLLQVEQESTNLLLEWQALLAHYRLPAFGMAELADWLAKRSLFLQRHAACEDLRR